MFTKPTFWVCEAWLAEGQPGQMFAQTYAKFACGCNNATYDEAVADAERCIALLHFNGEVEYVVRRQTLLERLTSALH